MKYKAGDRVKVKSLDWYNENKDEYGTIIFSTNSGDYSFTKEDVCFCGKVVTIAYEEEGHYLIAEDDRGYFWIDEMFEGLVEETSKDDEFNKMYQEMVKEADEKFKNHKHSKVSSVCQECVFAVNDNNPHCGLRGFRNDFNVKSCSAKNNVIPNGFELQSDGYFSWINKKEYPKTYEECCNVLHAKRYHGSLLETLQKLLICRDAYWKIAGEEMGLGKPWEPVYKSLEDNHYFTICTFNGKIECSATAHRNAIFTFQTAEMRDAFYENFKSEIEFCKELL